MDWNEARTSQDYKEWHDGQEERLHQEANMEADAPLPWPAYDPEYEPSDFDAGLTAKNQWKLTVEA
jgi:hypothetical protein